jgi:predicted transcriptional regulator of viral defense system
MKHEALAGFVERLQGVAHYTFTKAEAQQATGLRANGFKVAAWRLEQAKRIVGVRRGFYVIVPVEYRAGGILPPDWFINDLMKFFGQPYYVGLLSAAELHGAAHQRPQAFHVITSKPTREVEAAGLRIRFFKKANVAATPQVKKRTFTGDIAVSSPAATALDLVAYERRIGGLDRVLTVLQELGESIAPDGLVEAVKADGRLPQIQRLGWLLDKAGHKRLTGKLHKWLGRYKTKTVALAPSLTIAGHPHDPRWYVVVNTEVESDL